MPDQVSRKWRPPLLMVLGGALAAVLVLPVVGLFAVRAMQEALGFRQAALLVAAGVAVVTLALGWLLWRLLVLPIRALAARTVAVRMGEPAGALQHYGTAELGIWAGRFWAWRAACRTARRRSGILQTM